MDAFVSSKSVLSVVSMFESKITWLLAVTRRRGVDVYSPTVCLFVVTTSRFFREFIHFNLITLCSLLVRRMKTELFYESASRKPTIHHMCCNCIYSKRTKFFPLCKNVTQAIEHGTDQKWQIPVLGCFNRNDCAYANWNFVPVQSGATNLPCCVKFRCRVSTSP